MPLNILMIPRNTLNLTGEVSLCPEFSLKSLWRRWKRVGNDNNKIPTEIQNFQKYYLVHYQGSPLIHQAQESIAGELVVDGGAWTSTEKS